MLTSDAPELIVSGPAGTGKSRTCLEKLHAMAIAWPRSRHLIARKTRASLTETGLVTFERDVLGPHHPAAAGASRAFRQAYRYPNGSEIIVGGLDKPGKVLSAEFDLIYVQQAEEVTEEDWETLSTRLRNGRMPFQQLLGDCNPSSPRHWLKRRADLGLTPMLESRHEDNPALWMNGAWTEYGSRYMARLDALTGVRKLRLRYGRWVQAEGVIYEGWDPLVHQVDRFEIPASWRRFRTVDFGFTNPFVCQWWAIDEDGRMFLYRQIYRTRRTVRAHAEQINTLTGEESIEITVCDHDAEDSATLQECGIATTPAEKAVSVGIQAVQERLKIQPDGRARLYIVRDSLVETDELLEEAKLPLSTEQEFDGYVWANKDAREEPVKKDDHGMDALRYAVMYVDRYSATGGIHV